MCKYVHKYVNFVNDKFSTHHRPPSYGPGADPDNEVCYFIVSHDKHSRDGKCKDIQTVAELAFTQKDSAVRKKQETKTQYRKLRNGARERKTDNTSQD